MPARNRVKEYVDDSYYHVYNRGVNRQKIFKTPGDYAVFLNLFKRYLSAKPTKDDKGRDYPWLHEEVKLLAFCLMPNHFHLLLYQTDPQAMTRLLSGVATSYTMYFNREYKRLGPLFQDVFKASLITNDAYLEHISRYIHLNPENYLTWEFSSMSYYLKQKQATWIDPKPILELFEGTSYSKFLADYTDHRKMLKRIAKELADL